MTPLDALSVINELKRLVDGQSGSGEWIVNTGSFDQATDMYDLETERPITQAEQLGVPEDTVAVTKTSVFDNAASVQLDSIVEALATDSAGSRTQSGVDPLDEWFAKLQ